MSKERLWQIHNEISSWYNDAFRDTTNRQVMYYEQDRIAMVRLTATTDDGRELMVEYPRDNLESKLAAIKVLGIQRQQEVALA